MVFSTKHELQRHKSRTFPCTAAEAKHVCSCGRRYRQAAGLSRHKKTCKGRPDTIESLREAKEKLEMSLRLVGASPEAIRESTTITNNNTINQTNNIEATFNINVLNFGQEDMSFLQSMPVEELKAKLGCLTGHQPLRKFMQLLRMDPDQPQNHNLMLISPNHGVKFDRGAWHQLDDKKKLDIMLKNAVSYDAERLIDLIKHEGSMEQYEDSFLWPGVLHKTRVDDMDGLAPVLNDLRDDLTAFTSHTARALSGTDADAVDGLDGGPEKNFERLRLEQEKTKQAGEKTKQEEEKTKQKQAETAIKQLELQIQLANLQLEMRKHACALLPEPMQTPC